MRVAVLGLGGVGVQAARFLAKAGHEVTGFEQYALDHDRGSSYGGSRIIRRVYPDAFYAGLMGAAYPLWDELEAESGEALMIRCGGFYFAPEEHPELLATEAALSQVGVAYERLSAAETARRFPPFRLSDGECGVYEPGSGLLRASRVVRASARLARAAGAELREGTRVRALEPGPGAVVVRTEEEALEFERVVVTGGPWTASLLEPWVRLPLTVTRQQYAHFAVSGDRAAFSPEAFPVWIDLATHFYGYPEHDEIPGVKVALHQPGPAHDPDSSDRQPRAGENELLTAYLRRRLPDAAGAVTYQKVCLYTMSPDEDFIVDRLPGEARVVFVGGLSGHGFKFTVLLGALAARLAEERDPGHDLSRFRLARFQV